MGSQIRRVSWAALVAVSYRRRSRWSKDGAWQPVLLVAIRLTECGHPLSSDINPDGSSTVMSVQSWRNMSSKQKMAGLLLAIVSAMALMVASEASAITNSPSDPNVPDAPAQEKVFSPAPSSSKPESQQENCSKAFKRLDELARRGSTGGALCFQPMNSVPKVPAVEPPYPPDSWCFDERIVNKGWRFLRDAACQRLFGRINVVRVVGPRPVVVGWVSAFITNWSKAWPEDPTWYQAQLIQATGFWGDVAGLTAAGTGFVCRGRRCTVAGGRYPRQPLTLAKSPLGQFRFRPIATARGSRVKAKTSIEYTFWKPGFPSTDPAYARPPEVRCDHALPGRTKPGCVFVGNMPVMVYHLSGPYAELARHIRAAQLSGLPGAYKRGKALRRLTDQTKQRQNRDRSCPRGRGGYPRPPGLPVRSCDEYPMASTHQGAYTANPSGRPRNLRRTFRWCRIRNVPHRTGPKGYSVCMINNKHNVDGGGALDDFYVEQRVLGGDLFRVWIPEGS